LEQVTLSSTPRAG